MSIDPSVLFINLSGMEQKEVILGIQQVFNEVINECIEQNNKRTFEKSSTGVCAPIHPESVDEKHTKFRTAIWLKRESEYVRMGQHNDRGD